MSQPTSTSTQNPENLNESVDLFTSDIFDFREIEMQSQMIEDAKNSGHTISEEELKSIFSPQKENLKKLIQTEINIDKSDDIDLKDLSFSPFQVDSEKFIFPKHETAESQEKMKEVSWLSTGISLSIAQSYVDFANTNPENSQDFWKGNCLQKSLANKNIPKEEKKSLQTFISIKKRSQEAGTIGAMIKNNADFFVDNIKTSIIIAEKINRDLIAGDPEGWMEKIRRFAVPISGGLVGSALATGIASRFGIPAGFVKSTIKHSASTLGWIGGVHGSKSADNAFFGGAHNLNLTKSATVGISGAIGSALGGAITGSKWGALGVGIGGGLLGNLAYSNNSKGIDQFGEKSIEWVKKNPEVAIGGLLGIGLMAAYLFSGDSEEKEGETNSSSFGKWLGIGALGIAGLFGLSQMDWIKKLLPNGVNGLMEDAKDSVIKKGEDLLEDGKEKLEEADEKVTDFWEGPENPKTGEREGGKREEWAKILEEKGYTDFAYRLRNFSTGALEISGVIGGGLALLIFKKLFLGGATKFFLGGKKRAVVMLGVAWALGTYLIKDGENLSKKEILEKFDVLADLEKKKNEILDIYAHHGFTTGKIIEKISDNFSPENAVKYIDSMFTPESGVKGFFSENGADMAKGGMAIVGTLVALNAVGAFARLLFTKKGILASISLFLYSMGGDITQMRSFYNATKEAFGKPLQEQFSKVSTPVLQKVLPEYEFLQTSMRTLGMSVYDYSLSPEETKITQGSLEFLQKKYKNSSDRDERRFAEKAEEIQRILREQKIKDKESSTILQTRDFTILCLRAKRIGLEVLSSFSEGKFSVSIDGKMFSGFPFDPLLTDNFPRTDEQIEQSRNILLKEGLSKLYKDILVHGTGAFQKQYGFTSNGVDSASKTTKKLLEKLENASLTKPDILELEKSLAKMNARLYKNDQGEIFVHFSSDDSVFSLDTFVGFHPELSHDEFLENEEFLNLYIVEATLKGYSNFFAESTKGILSVLDATGSGENMKDLIEAVNSNPELAGSPHLWAEVFIAIYQDASSGERGVGMTILDGTILITAGAVGIPIEISREAWNIMIDILSDEFSLDKTLVESPLGTVLAVGVAAKGLEKGFHYVGARKLGKVAGVIRWGSLTVPKHMVLLPYTTGKYAWKGLKGIAGVSSEIFGRIPLLSPDVMWKNTQSRLIGLSDGIVSKYRGRSVNPFKYGFSRDPRFQVISDLRVAQREYRKKLVAETRGGAEITHSEKKIGDRWFKKYDELKNKYKDLGTSRFLKGSHYEGKSFEDLMKQEKNISIRDAKLPARQKGKIISTLAKGAKKMVTSSVNGLSHLSETITSGIKKPKNTPENPKKILKDEIKGLSKMMNLSPEKEAKLLKLGGSLVKTLGVVGAIYLITTIAEAKNPYSAVTKEAVTASIFVLGAKLGNTVGSAGGGVGRIIGTAVGIAAAGVAILVWGDDAEKEIMAGFKKIEVFIDKNGYSKSYIGGGEAISTFSSVISGGLSTWYDISLGEVFKGENAYEYFSDTNKGISLSKGGYEYLHRDSSDIESWNTDLNKKISDLTAESQKYKYRFEKSSERMKSQVISEYGENPEISVIISSLQSLQEEDDPLFFAKQAFLEWKNIEVHYQTLKNQKIPENGGKWVTIQAGKFLSNFTALQSLEKEGKKNTVEYFRALKLFIIQYKTLSNMNLLSTVFDLISDNYPDDKRKGIHESSEISQFLANLYTDNSLTEEIKDLLE